MNRQDQSTEEADADASVGTDGQDPGAADIPGDGKTHEESGGEQMVETLRAQIRRLEDENALLRERYASARDRRYQRTALGLGVVGVLFSVLGVVVVAAQEVLFALGAVGLFGAILTRYLTPDQFIPLTVGEGIYRTLSDNEAAVVDQLGLSSTHVYLTTEDGPRLFVPEIDSYDETLLESSQDGESKLQSPLVVGDHASRSGLSVRPVALSLLRTFDDQRGETLPAEPREAVSILREGVTDGLELASDADVDLDSDDGRVTFSLQDPIYGDVTRFDHPIPSFLGCGLARALDVPVTVDVATAEKGGNTTPLVTCRWEPNDDANVT